MFFVILLQCLFIKLVLSTSEHPILIVVSYDAFRYNFFKKGITPYMESLKTQGTYVDYLENVFPTKTFPNHHSIATGVYPEVHGVVDNNFYDPKLSQIVKISYEMFHYNEEVLPIWTLNQKAGKGRHSGSMMWPGGIYPYKNITPTHSKAWDPQYDFYKRVDDIISWIQDPSKPANLIMFYIEEPDSLGHGYGSDSEQVENMLRTLDNVTRYLEDQLVKNQLKNKVNVIHLSDHGMISVSPPHFLDLTTYLKEGTYQIAGSSPLLHFIPDDGNDEEIYTKLLNASKENGHFTVYRKGDFPEHWHYKNNPRVGPIIVMAEVGYAFQDILESIKYYIQKYNIKVTDTSKFGVHGYDNEVVPDMRPFFMARGPLIKKNNYLKSFKTVDLYNIFCDILSLQPTKNNGTTTLAPKIVIKKKGGSIIPTVLTAAAATLVALLLVVLCAVAVTLMTIKRQQNLTTAAALNKRFQQNFHHSSIEAQHLLEPEDA